MSSDKSPTVWKSHMTKGLSYELDAGYLLWFLPETHCVTNGSPLTCLGLFSDTVQCACGFMCEDGETASRWLATHPKQSPQSSQEGDQVETGEPAVSHPPERRWLVLEFNELHE